METSNANPSYWTIAELAVLEKPWLLKLEQEKEKGQERVFSRNVPELKQDLRHSEAE